MGTSADERRARRTSADERRARRTHPGAEHTDPPPARRVLGVTVPPQRVEAVGTAGRETLSRNAKRAAGWGSLAVALALGMWQGLPPVLAALRGPQSPPTEHTCECPGLDAVQARQELQRRQLERIAEAVCDANQGPPLVDFPCPDDHEYQTPHKPPPLRRSPRVYPTE